MAIIHRTFRAGYAEAAQLVRAPLADAEGRIRYRKVRCQSGSMTHGWAPSFMDAAGQTTLTIALVNDYNIVVMGNRAHSRVVPLLVKGFTRARPRRRARSDPRRRHRDQRATLRARSIGRLNWSGRSEGFTDRESEILALITQGRSNAEVAPLTHLVRTL
jgi:hypothetical protein